MNGDFNGGNYSEDENDMDLDEKGKVSSRSGEMDIDGLQDGLTETNKLVKNLGKVVRDLRSLGFTSMTEDAYASEIFLLLKVTTCLCNLRFSLFSFTNSPCFLY